MTEQKDFDSIEYGDQVRRVVLRGVIARIVGAVQKEAEKGQRSWGLVLGDLQNNMRNNKRGVQRHRVRKDAISGKGWVAV